MTRIKLAFAVYLLFCGSCYCFSQPTGKFDEWGKVTMDELKMKECPFEKDADAVLLLNIAQAYYEVKNNTVLTSTGKFLMTTSYYKRVKIFNERGSKKAEIHIRFKSGKKEEVNYNVAITNEDITDIKAITYNLAWDGEGMLKTELAPGDIHRTKLNDFEWEISFTIPAVKKGSVFELSYNRAQYVFSTLPTWNFCSDIPTFKSSISIGFLDAISYYTEEFVHHIQFKKLSQPFTSRIKVPVSAQRSWGMINKDFLTGTTVTYSAVNIHSVNDEPYMNSVVNYTDRVSFQLKAINPPFGPYDGVINSWTGFADNLLSKPDFGERLSDGGIPNEQLKTVVNETMSSEEKAKAIFEFIRANMNWDGSDTIMAVTNNSKAWKNKTGNNADINFLLINTLRAAGLTAYPCLTGSRTTGYINMEYPINDQFKELVALVELNGNKIILDATDKFTPFGLTEYTLLNNYCFFIRGPGSSGWFDTFNQGDNSETAIVNARLDSAGKMQGEIVAIFDNYSLAMFREMKATGRDSSIDKEMKKRIGNVIIESTNDTIDETRNRFVRKVKFSSRLVNDNDSLVRLSLSAIYGQTHNPFTSSHRQSDVDFGYRQKVSSLLTIELPVGYELDSSPRPTVLLTPDSSISFRIGAEQRDNILYVQQKLEYHKSFYPLSDYPTFFEFEQQYYKLMQEPIVLRKKPRP